MNSDEELARRLQNMEFEQAQRNNQRQEVSDEEYARQLAMEERNASRTNPNQANRQMVLQPGEKTAVRLFHPFTRSSIGEAVYVHYLDRAMMLFQLVQAPQKYLRVRPDGIADFAEISPMDYSAMFACEVRSDGKILLKTMSMDIRGFGRYLILINGMLRGDGSPGHSADWMMISANALPPPPQPAMWNPSSVTAANTYPIPPGPVTTTVPPSAQATSTGPNNQTYTAVNTMDNSMRESAVLPAGYTQISNDDDHFEAVNPMFRRASTTPRNADQNRQADPTPAMTNQSQSAAATVPEPSKSPRLPTSASNLFHLSQSFAAPTASNHQPPSSDTHSPDQIFSWLTTTNEGREYLQSPQLASVKRLLEQGSLLNILHRPDWIALSSRYRDYLKEPMPYDPTIASQGLPDPALQRFFQQGYVVMNSVVGQEELSKVRRYMNHYLLTKPNSVSKGNIYGEISLTGFIESDYDILRLFYATPIVDIVQRLLGRGDVQRVTTGKVILIAPSIAEPFARIEQQGKSWHVEGFARNGSQSNHSLIVGIALSDFRSDNEGNLCVHPKSHDFIHQHIAGSDVRGKRALFSDAAYHSNKPDLGSPKQLHLSAGDIVLYTSKLATQIAPNLAADMKSMVYFHIVHVDHSEFKDPSMDGVAGVWIEYKGVDILEKPTQEEDLISLDSDPLPVTYPSQDNFAL